MDKVIESVFKALAENWPLTFSISGVIATFGGYLFRLIYMRRQKVKAAKDLVEYQFSYQNVKSKCDLFIDTQGQNITPSVEDEAQTSSAFIVKKKLIPFFLKTAFKKKERDKFYLVLADSGMGKTTFMINLYLRYTSFFSYGNRFNIRLLPFGNGKIIEKIDEIKKKEDPSQTILLLDAFDEYQKLIPPDLPDGLTDEERFRKVLEEVIDAVEDFREVVITSRTQYFPGQEDKSYILKIRRFSKEEGYHELVKLYISPFDNHEIQRYLNRKYGVFKFWNKAKKQTAKRIVYNSHKLMVRPMLLDYIDYLVGSNQDFVNTYQIYETLINKWIDREGDKREYQPIYREKLKRNLHKYSQLVAVKIYERRKTTNLLQLCKADATDINVELKDYQMTGQSLLTRDAESNWKFAHKSILEFFLAKEITENIDFALQFDFSGMDMSKDFCSEKGIGSFVISNYIRIPGTEFLMGSPESEFNREEIETRHRVKLSDYYMYKYAVTVADFKKFIEDSDYLTDAEKGDGSYRWKGTEWKQEKGINWKHGVSGKERGTGEYNHPVVHVSWNDAVAYCAWLSAKTSKTFRLPTEAEWEFACRAGTTTPFNTGDNLSTDQANYNGNFPYCYNKKGIYRETTVPVNHFQPNGFGLYNMHGNVWEWCNDWYDEKSYDESKANGTVENPGGSKNGSFRIVRGGGWHTYGQNCRSAYRSNYIPNRSYSNLGFRLVFVP